MFLRVNFCIVIIVVIVVVVVVMIVEVRLGRLISGECWMIQKQMM